MKTDVFYQVNAVEKEVCCNILLQYKSMDFCLRCNEVNIFNQGNIWLQILRERISERKNVSNCRTVSLAELPDLLLWLHAFLHMLLVLRTSLITEIIKSIFKRVIALRYLISIDKLFSVPLKNLAFCFPLCLCIP